MADLKWDPGAGGCVFVPKVRLIDNWGWCTKSGGAERPSGIFCLDNPAAFIEFAGRVVTR